MYSTRPNSARIGYALSDGVEGLVIGPQDDRFHSDGGDPFWNESSWASFAVPERGLCGWVYFFHRPNMRYSVGGVAVWSPGGEHVYDCDAYSWGDTLPLPDEAEVFDFQLANGFAVRTEELLRRYSYTFGNERCEVDLRWSAVIDPVGAPLPEGVQSWGGGHFEQPGRMSGRVRVGA